MGRTESTGRISNFIPRGGTGQELTIVEHIDSDTEEWFPSCHAPTKARPFGSSVSHIGSVYS